MAYYSATLLTSFGDPLHRTAGYIVYKVLCAKRVAVDTLGVVPKKNVTSVFRNCVSVKFTDFNVSLDIVDAENRLHELAGLVTVLFYTLAVGRDTKIADAIGHRFHFLYALRSILVDIAIILYCEILCNRRAASCKRHTEAGCISGYILHLVRVIKEWY